MIILELSFASINSNQRVSLNKINYSKLVLLFFIFIYNPNIYSREISFNTWAKEQWKLIPLEQRLSIPDISIKIDIQDQVNLKIDADPLLRNNYINSMYGIIGNQLARCMNNNNSNIANWYHFATWASKSAGDVISGKKFQELGKFKKTLFWAGGATRAFKNKKLQKELFANTNAMIAIEMIPLGKTFLDLFCTKKNDIPFKQFENIFNARLKYEKTLLKAFEFYYSAIKARGSNEKLEYITLGSIYQVIAEQARIDRILKSIFTSKIISKKLDKIYKKIATKEGKLTIGSKYKTHVYLNKNVKTNILPSDLRVIQNNDFIYLNRNYEISNDLKVNDHSFKGTAVKNWGDLTQRTKFLIAFFRSYIKSKHILDMPGIYLKYYKTYKEFYLVSTYDISGRLLNEKETFIYKRLKSYWNESISQTRKPKDMLHRAKLFLHLNYLSKENFPFGLSISHLTLAIERSSYMHLSIEEKK